jgi:hypothetical protein
MFLYYILVRRLLRGLVTAFQIKLDFVYLFHPSGAYRIAQNVSPEDLALSGDLWALVDSNDTVTAPSRTLLDLFSPFFLVYSSSPREDRWKKWAKSKGQLLHFMELPSWTEAVSWDCHVFLCRAQCHSLSLD